MENKTLTVQDLLDALQTVPDKSLPVYVYNYNDKNVFPTYPITHIDTFLTDRVDLNVFVGEQ